MVSINPQNQSPVAGGNETLSQHNISSKRVLGKSDQKASQIGEVVIAKSALSLPTLSNPDDIIKSLEGERKVVQHMITKLRPQTTGLTGSFNRLFNPELFHDTKAKLRNLSNNKSHIDNDIKNLKKHGSKIKRELYMQEQEHEIGSTIKALNDLEKKASVFKHGSKKGNDG